MPVYHFTVAGVPLAVRIPQFEKPLCKYRKMKLQRFGSWNLFLSIGKKPLPAGPLVELISNLDSKNINMPSVTPASDCCCRSIALGILISSLSTFQISSRSMQPGGPTDGRCGPEDLILPVTTERCDREVNIPALNSSSVGFKSRP
jgi:hypothetical protein